MRSELIKGLLAASLGVALVGAAVLARPAVAQDNLPDGPGKAVLVAACSGCHGVSQVTGEHQTADQWTSTVTSMINNGANVPDAQFDTLVAYLATNFGPEGQPAPAASAPATPATGATTPPAGGTAPAPTPPADSGAAPAAPPPSPTAQ
jgi:mono/diheme cytochrome c family protein